MNRPGFVVVPGVGAFAAVMRGLREVGGPRMIERRLAGGRPVLGICVGMQVMFTSGQEHGTHDEVLDQWPGTVDRLQAPIVPHMGWSQVRAPEGSRLFAGLEGERFYFVHSYAVQRDPNAGLADESPLAPPLVTWAEHGPQPGIPSMALRTFGGDQVLSPPATSSMCSR